MTDAPLAIVMAAGKGTRMRSARPKVVHAIAGKPMLLHVVELARGVTGRLPLVVVGEDQTEVTRLLEGIATTVLQSVARGTGDAIRSVPAELRSDGPVLVLSGDVPLLRPGTVEGLIARHRAGDAACSLLTVVTDTSSGMGRVLRDERGLVTRIVEVRDLPPDGVAHPEANAGVYVFDGARLWAALERLSAHNAAGEYYLTDVIELIDGAVNAIVIGDPLEAMGVNDRVQLARAEGELRRRNLERLMQSGVTIIDPATTYADVGVEVGRDTVIHPMTLLAGGTRLGERCEIGPMAQLHGVVAGDRVVVGASYLEGCELGNDVRIGQYDRVRPQTRLGAGVTLGTHAEVKNSTVGAGSTISHFSCLLDSDVGSGVNFSAGAVTCNYDGVRKSRTVIEDGAFIGSDAMLVAPLTIGAGAYVAAGSVITRDVPGDALAVERAPSRIALGWAKRHRGASGGDGR